MNQRASLRRRLLSDGVFRILFFGTLLCSVFLLSDLSPLGGLSTGRIRSRPSPWAALASGAYMLAENYLYTTESFRLMLDHLAPGGILQITRMAAEMENSFTLGRVPGIPISISFIH